MCASASTRSSIKKIIGLDRMLTTGVILFLQLQLPFSWWNPLTEAIFLSTHPPILQMVKLDDVWNKHFRKFTILLLVGFESYIRVLDCWYEYFPPSTSFSLRIQLFLVVMPTEETRLEKKKDCYRRTPGCRRKKTENSWRAPVLGPTSKFSLQD